MVRDRFGRNALYELASDRGGDPEARRHADLLIPADAPPSFDGHRENTFATIHAVAPFYSVLIRVNPKNPASATDFICDVCTEIPEPTDDGRTYAFAIRTDVNFSDLLGSRLTMWRRAGMRSSRRRLASSARARAIIR